MLPKRELELPKPEAIEQMPQHRVRMCRQELRDSLGELTNLELELISSIGQSESGDAEALRSVRETKDAIKALTKLCTVRLVDTAANGPRANRKSGGNIRKPLKDPEPMDGVSADEDAVEPIRGHQLRQLGVGFRED